MCLLKAKWTVTGKVCCINYNGLFLFSVFLADWRKNAHNKCVQYVDTATVMILLSRKNDDVRRCVAHTTARDAS